MNYIKLSSRLINQEYAYFDVPDYYADNLIKQKNIKVKFISEMKKPDVPYIVIFCSVNKKDCAIFESAMVALEKKMLVCGYTDYLDFCHDFINKHNLK